jgi:uncharacterized repeat protein (TIGR01451 family)
VTAWLRILTAAVAAALALCAAPAAGAAIFQVLPASFEGVPELDFETDDALYAVGTSDFLGGTLCVVSASATSGNCKSPAWGDSNQVITLGSFHVLIENPMLSPGRWRILADGGLIAPDVVSLPFTVHKCTVCTPQLSSSIAQLWKTSAGQLASALDRGCSTLDLVDGVTDTGAVIGAGTGLIKDLAEEFLTPRTAVKLTGLTLEGTMLIGSSVGFLGVVVAAGADIPTSRLDAYMLLLRTVTCRADRMYEDMAADPPDPDYRQTTAPIFSTFPVSGDTSVDGLTTSLDRLYGYGRAALKAFERYQGAAAAGDLSWVHTQAGEFAANTHAQVNELRASAELLRTFAGRVGTERPNDPVATQPQIDAVALFFKRIREQGFEPSELAALSAAGMTADDITALRKLFDHDVSTAAANASLPSVLNALAAELETRAFAFDSVAREADVVAASANSPPVASFTAAPTSGPAPLDVTFTDTSTPTDRDPIEEWSWDFGDGQTGSGPQVTHRFAADGTYRVTLTVSDGVDSFAGAGKTITVGATANRSPAAAGDSLSTSTGTPGSVNVLANDSDPDGDALTVTGSTNGQHGSVTCASGGLCTYTSNAGYVGTDSFAYTVSDGRGGTAQGTVAVTVTAIPIPNRPPTAVDDVLTTAEATAGSINVLLNDSDPDGDQLHVSAITAAGHGSVSCAPTGLCTYTPSAGFSGGDSFAYSASDGRGGTATASVAVTVSARGNVPPVAVDDQVSTNEDAAVSFNPLTNDTDGDGDALAVTSITAPARGALTCAGSGACTYTPGANLNGTDHVDYTVSDGHGGIDVGTITITVAPVNDPPSPKDDVLTAGTGTPTTVNVLANDVDVDGDKLVLVGSTPPGHGTVSCVSSTGACTYTAVAGYLGPDSFSYTASDGHGGTGTASVAITVVAAPPVARIVATPTRGFAPLGVTFDAGTSTDVDGDIVSYEWTFGDGGSALGRLVTHTYVTPATRTATLKVTDSGGRSSSVSVTIFVQDIATLTLPICGDQDTGPVVPRCTDYELLREVQMYEVPGTGPVDVRFDWILREAAFNNELAVYDADDALGSVGGLRPGDPGYLAAAFGRARVVFPSGSNASTPDRTLTFEGGDVLVLFIVQNNTLAQLLLRNPTNQPNLGPQAFFSLDALNADGADHQFGYRSKLDQSIQFGFEDLAGGGGDFNDIVFNIYASLRPIPPLVVTKTADDPVSEPGHANGYTITVTNSGATAILDSISDTLPEGFSYLPGTSSGATTADPQVSGRTLRWSGPFTVGKGQSVTLRFRVNVAASPGAYLNEATADARGFAIAPTGPTAKVLVSGTSNRPPVALGGTVTTNEETPVGVVLNASDPDGDALALTVVDPPQHGTLTGTAPNLTYTPAAGYAGPDAFTFRANDGTVDSSLAQIVITVVRVQRPTATVYDGGTSVQYSDPVLLSAVLRDTLRVPSVPVAGQQVGFVLGAQLAVGGPTGADGRASASLVVDQRPGSATQVVTSFAGDARYLPSADADAFTIEREDCTLAYSGDIVVQPLAMTTLAADLGESDASLGDRSRRTITFTAVGVANPAPQVFSAVTGPAGQASTLAALPADVYAIAISFAGDDFYKPCSGPLEAVVTVEPASAKVTGGGWISIATGRTAFGFNAIPQAGGGWSGQLQLRGANGKNRFHAGVVTTLTSSGRSAAWSGTGAWNGVPGYSYTVSVVDNGSSGSKKGDTIAILVKGPTGETVYTSGPAQTLKGGNITVH